MQHQAVVIGLGQFGMSVARTLAERRIEVLAIDVEEERVREAASFATQAICMDATVTDALARTAPERRDVCLCAIGDDAKEASIICTALLKQMGARRLIARANDDLHARILTLVGADTVINPEREFGERFANQLLYQGVKGEMPLGEELMITEVESPNAFIGHSLIALHLPSRFGVTVVAVRRSGEGRVMLPDPKLPIARGDVFVVVARKGAVAQMLERS